MLVSLRRLIYDSCLLAESFATGLVRNSKNGSVFADPRYGNFKKSNKENKEMRSIQGKNSNFAALRWQAATLQGVF